MTASITVEGLEALDVALSEFPKKFANKGVKKSLKSAMQDVVLKSVLRGVPVKTGNLKRSLKVRTARGRNGRRIPRGVFGFSVQTTKTKRRDGFYGLWVFTGATNRDGSKRSGTRTLRNALYGNANRLKSKTVANIRRELPNIARAVKIDSLRYKG